MFLLVSRGAVNYTSIFEATANTYNVTGRHRGPKRKLRAAGWLQSAVTKTDVLCAVSHIFDYWTSWYILSSSVVSRAFTALCVYSTLHHPHSPCRLPLCQISFLSLPPLLS